MSINITYSSFNREWCLAANWRKLWLKNQWKNLWKLQ